MTMAVNSDFVGGYNPYAQGLATSQPKSLLDQKLDNIYAKNEEKLDAVAPTSEPSSLYEIDNSNIFTGGLAGSGGEDLWDVAQASTLNSLGNYSDLVTGNVRTNQERTDSSRASAGLSDEGYQRMVQDNFDGVSSELAKGNWWEAAKNIPSTVMPAIADSAGSLLGTTLGALGVAGATAAAPVVAPIAGAVGLASVAKKLYSGAKTAGNVVDAVEDAKKANLVAKTAKLTKEAIKAAPKAAAQMSLVTADITQSQVNEYRENFGEDPSTFKVIGMAAANLGSLIFNPAIIKNVFVPSFKKRLKEEVEGITKNLVKGSNLAELGIKAAQGIKRVGAAGLAEGTQEYVQAWVEVLNTKVGPEDTGKFLEAVSREIGDKDNQLNAIMGAYIGAGAGAGIRSATAVPGLAASGSIDLAKATGKGTVKVTKAVAGKGLSMGADMAARTGEKLLTPEDRLEIREEKARNKRLADQKVEAYETQITSIGKAATVEELVSDNLVDSILTDSGEWTTEELRDPKTFKEAKEYVISELKDKQNILKAEVEKDSWSKATGMVGGNVKSLAKQAKVNAVKGVKAAAKYTETEKLLKTVADFGTASVEAVKNMDTGTAKGLVSLGIKGGKNSYRDILDGAKDLSVSDIDNMVTVLSAKEQTKDTVKIVRDLKNLSVKKAKNLVSSGRTNESRTKLNNVPTNLVDAANSSNITPAQADSVIESLTSTLRGTILELGALEVIEAAHANYEKSSSYNDSNNARTNGVIKNLLKKHSKKIREPLIKSAEKKIAEIKESVVDVGVLPYLKDTPAASKLVELMETSPTLQEFQKQGSKVIKAAGVAKGSFKDMPDMSTDEGAAQANAALESLYNSTAKTASDAYETLQDITFGKKATAAKKVKKDAENVTKAATDKDTADKLKFSDKLNSYLSVAEKNLSEATELESIEDLAGQYINDTSMAFFGKAGIATAAEATALVSKYPTISKSVTMAAEIKKAFPETVEKQPETKPEVQEEVEQAVDNDSVVQDFTGSEYLDNEVESKVIDKKYLDQKYIDKYGKTCAFRLKETN